MPIKLAITGTSAKHVQETILLDQKQARELQKELHDLLGPYIAPEPADTEPVNPEPTVVPMEEPKPEIFKDILKEWERRQAEKKPWHEQHPWTPNPLAPTWTPQPTTVPYKLPDVWCRADQIDPKFTAAAVVDWSKVNGHKLEISSNPADNKGTTFP